MRSCLGVGSFASLRVGVAGLLILAAAPLAWPGGNSAEAATEYYTRKRVNGKWVTGRFPRDGAAEVATKPAAPQRTASLSVRDVEPDAVPSRSAIPLPPVSPHTAGGLPQASVDPAVRAVPEIVEDRMARLRDALKTRASEIAASVTAGVSASLPAIDPAGPPAPPVAPVSATPPAVPSLGPARSAVPLVRNPLEPRSVSYDFETGVKTTVFENSVVREPFDVAAMRVVTRPAAR